MVLKVCLDTFDLKSGITQLVRLTLSPWPSPFPLVHPQTLKNLPRL
jgi:hypothetical protein